MFHMSDKHYDILNKIQRWLPALGLFYIGLAQIWGVPYGDEINKTIVLIATLLGTTLEIATSTYEKEMRLKEEKKEE